jgi:hypothetical protein
MNKELFEYYKLHPYEFFLKIEIPYRHKIHDIKNKMQIFEKNALNNFKKNKYSFFIKSRIMFFSTLVAKYYLYEAIFNKKNIFVLTYESSTTYSFIGHNKFLSEFIKRKTSNEIIFKNDAKICFIQHHNYKNKFRGKEKRESDILIIDEIFSRDFNFLEENNLFFIFEKIIIGTTPTLQNFDIIKHILKNYKFFKKILLHWTEDYFRNRFNLWSWKDDKFINFYYDSVLDRQNSFEETCGIFHTFNYEKIANEVQNVKIILFEKIQYNHKQRYTVSKISKHDLKKFFNIV